MCVCVSARHKIDEDLTLLKTQIELCTQQHEQTVSSSAAMTSSGLESAATVTAPQKLPMVKLASDIFVK